MNGIVASMLVTIAAIYDVKIRRIPKPLGYVSLLVAIFLGDPLQLLISLALLAILLWMGAIGGGDFKILLAVGGIVGLRTLLHALLLGFTTSLIFAKVKKSPPPLLTFSCPLVVVEALMI